jgi:hypothetical protein
MTRSTELHHGTPEEAGMLIELLASLYDISRIKGMAIIYLKI